MALEEPPMPPDDQGLSVQQRDQFLERPLPNSPEAERGILGSILIDNSLIVDVIGVLTPDDFYTPAHRRVYAAMLALFEKGGQLNPIVISEELRKDGVLEQVGGIAAIISLTVGIPNFTYIASYVEIVLEKSKRRRIVKLCNVVTSQALEEEDELASVMEVLSKGTFDIALDTAKKGFEHAGALVHASIEEAWAIQTKGHAVTGITTGLNELDAITLGLQPADMIVIGARPSMGKTALVTQLALTASIVDNARVAMFSMEMSNMSIGKRLACSWARVNSQKFRGGFVNVEEWDRIHDAAAQIMQAPLYFDDTPALTTLEIKSKLRKFTMEHGGLELVIIDYLQLMTSTVRARSAENRNQEIRQISGELKQLAKETNAPFIVLSQLSRGPEHRTDKRPQLADLRESGSIEQDADVVVLMYREDQYKGANDPSAKTHTAELNVAKQRNGPTGTILVQFDETVGRFNNLAKTEMYA